MSISHLSLAHEYWTSVLEQGDWAVDATCGNGKDTLRLAELVLPQQGGVIALDIQKQAVENTSQRLQQRFSSADLARIFIYHQSHAEFPPLAETKPIKLIVYNLGYLPGGGNKFFTTQTLNTLQSISKALTLVSSRGMISITCYPGHEEGLKEQLEIEKFIIYLDENFWHVQMHKNKPLSPSLVIIKKLI